VGRKLDPRRGLGRPKNAIPEPDGVLRPGAMPNQKKRESNNRRFHVYSAQLSAFSFQRSATAATRLADR
jgi:hypothetical protein